MNHFDWQLLNFLWLDVIDERDRTALQYQRDLNHDGGDLVFIEDVKQFYSPLPEIALRFASVQFILNRFAVASF